MATGREGAEGAVMGTGVLGGVENLRQESQSQAIAMTPSLWS